MNWTTLYITGRGDFREDVRRKLDSSRLNFMPGYMENSSGIGDFDLYWLDEKVPLRKLKETIGGKLIWKYRLRFCTDLEQFLQSINPHATSNDLSPEEKDLLTAMRKSA